MIISITCPNGHNLKANDSYAGRTLSCPVCGAKISVPTPESDGLSSAEPLNSDAPSSPSGQTEDFFSVQSPVAQPYVPAPTTPSSTAPPAAKTATNNMMLYLIIGGGMGGSALALLLMLGLWLVLGRSHTTESPSDQIAQAGPQPTRSADRPSSSEQVPNVVSRNATNATPDAAVPDVRELLQEIKDDILGNTGSGSGNSENIQGITEKLKQIGLAFHHFHDVNRTFALLRVGDLEVIEPNRRPPPTGLSWRVHLLPYLDQKPLYEHFHLDEPWDSPHNQTLVDKMPEVYRIGSSTEQTTRFQVLTGPNALFGNPKPPAFRDLSDGARHTILAIVAGTDRATPWTKPDSLTIDETQPVASLGAMPDHLILCVMADGKPLVLHDNIESDKFLALTTPHGKEIIDADTFRRQFEEEQWDVREKRASSLAGLTPSPRSTASSTPNTQATSVSPAKLLTIVTDRMNKLKELVLAMHNYSDIYRQLPLANNAKYFDQDGKPFLSWRVHLLPFLDQEPLYSQFKLDEPWDSPNNRPLLDRMPEVFRDPQESTGGNKTRYITFTGPDTPFFKPQGLKFHEFRDGTSTTLLIVTAGPSKSVEWTKPEDIAFDPNAPVDCVGVTGEPAIFYARADGAVKVIQASIPPEMFKAIVTPSGGEKLPKDFANFEVK